jgi:hypothetical protein
MWVELQSVATMAAFGAAFWYAYIARRQTTVLVAQQALAQTEHIQRNKPVVYIDRVEHSHDPTNYDYVLHNVGGGFAINVYVYDESLSVAMAVGSLASGEQRVLPADLNRQLSDGHAGSRYLVLAEGPFSRTAQWTPTLNLRTPTEASDGGQVVHAAPMETTAESPRFQYQSAADFLRPNETRLRAALASL